jgi:hypothetical protein
MTVHDQVIEILRHAVRDLGDFIFAQSQVYVPRDDSTLATSGSIEYSPDEVIIRYRAIHSASVEHGHGEVVIRNPRQQVVRAHVRQDGSGMPSPVSTYNRVYRTGAVAHLRYGGRNIGFRVLGTEAHPIPARAGVWYLARSIADGVRVFPDIIESHLKVLERR